jgi:hypothetical protein
MFLLKKKEHQKIGREVGVLQRFPLVAQLLRNIFRNRKSREEAYTPRATLKATHSKEDAFNYLLHHFLNFNSIF